MTNDAGDLPRLRNILAASYIPVEDISLRSNFVSGNRLNIGFSRSDHFPQNIFQKIRCSSDQDIKLTHQFIGQRRLELRATAPKGENLPERFRINCFVKTPKFNDEDAVETRWLGFLLQNSSRKSEITDQSPINPPPP
jgi:hypothetical protein